MDNEQPPKPSKKDQAIRIVIKTIALPFVLPLFLYWELSVRIRNRQIKNSFYKRPKD